MNLREKVAHHPLRAQRTRWLLLLKVVTDLLSLAGVGIRGGNWRAPRANPIDKASRSPATDDTNAARNKDRESQTGGSHEIVSKRSSRRCALPQSERNGPVGANRTGVGESEDRDLDTNSVMIPPVHDKPDNVGITWIRPATKEGERTAVRERASKKRTREMSTRKGRKTKTAGETGAKLLPNWDNSGGKFNIGLPSPEEVRVPMLGLIDAITHFRAAVLSIRESKRTIVGEIST